MTEHRYESSKDACQRLNINAQTLYAYVSRGLIGTTTHPGDSRKRLYLSADIDLLKTQQNKGRSRHAVATSTINFGEPVLRSKVSSIDAGEFFYRGINAVELSETSTLERIFELLCNTTIGVGGHRTLSYKLFLGKSPFARIIGALSEQLINANGHGNKQHAYYLLRLLAANAANQAPLSPDETVHEILARAWTTHPEGADLIRRGLVLSADHELNASAYATRITASAGASLSACLMTGISTLSGSLHGGLTNRCLHWMREMQPRTSELEITATPPGFGHKLYPNGDPRPIAILKYCNEPKAWKEIREHILCSTSSHPTLDYGLALLENELALPKGSGFAIFAIGRTVGWLAHSFEQRKTGALIRPRAYS